MAKKVDSNKIKLELMKYWRYDRGYTFACTECINKSDITAINDKHLIEVEVKISKADFLKEFDGSSKNKTRKHSIYQHKRKPTKSFICPNFFYFCVTPDILTYVTEYLKDQYKNYGILVCEPYRLYGQKSFIRVAKKATKIHNTSPTLDIFHKIGKRVQSELINLKEKYLK